VFYDHLYEEGGLRQVRGEGGCTNAGFDRVGGALLGFCVCKRGGGLCLHPDTPGHSLRHPCMLHDYFTNRVSHLVTHMVCPMLSAAPPQCILDLLTLRQKHGLDCRAKVTVRKAAGERHDTVDCSAFESTVQAAFACPTLNVLSVHLKGMLIVIDSPGALHCTAVATLSAHRRCEHAVETNGSMSSLLALHTYTHALHTHPTVAAAPMPCRCRVCSAINDTIAATAAPPPPKRTHTHTSLCPPPLPCDARR
jgi:hypothetical protein